LGGGGLTAIDREAPDGPQALPLPFPKGEEPGGTLMVERVSGTVATRRCGAGCRGETAEFSPDGFV